MLFSYVFRGNLAAPFCKSSLVLKITQTARKKQVKKSIDKLYQYYIIDLSKEKNLLKYKEKRKQKHVN